MKECPVLHVPLCLIRSALCPLTFRATKVASVPEFQQAAQTIPALSELEVGEALRFESLFPYCDRNRNRKTGCQIVTAALGLSPEDIDGLFGLTTYLALLERGEGIPDDGRISITTNALARFAGLPRGGGSDVRRMQSRVLRLSHVKLTNTAVWNSRAASFHSLSNTELFSIHDMQLLTEPWQPIVLELSRSFLRVLRETPLVAVDRRTYRSLSRAAKRRLYLIVHREGWHHRESPLFDADAFTVHQLGYSKSDDPRHETRRRKDRLHTMRQLLREFEERDLIRPPQGGSYLSRPRSGSLRGRLCLRWRRGPQVETREARKASAALPLENDPLYEQVRALRDQEDRPLAPPVFRRMVADFGRARVQKHVNVVHAQLRLQPGSIRKSAVATFVDRVQRDHPFPSWYTPAVNAATFQSGTLAPHLEQRYQDLIRTV